MNIQGLYAAVYVRDIAAASAFYAKLLGRQPDDRPMDTLVQWRGFGNAGIQLFLDESKAGRGVMTIVVPNMEATGALLAAQVIDIGAVLEGVFGKIAHVTDPDGNVINLAEPPR